MKIINMTPHPINIVDGNGKVIRTLQPSGQIIRLSQSTQPEGEIDGILITKTVYGQAQGLPDYKDEIYYVVSQIIKNANPDRKDLLVPAEMVRDSNNNIIGCRSLGR